MLIFIPYWQMGLVCTPLPRPAWKLEMHKATLVYKAKATGIHFSISTLIFGVFLYLMLTKWYPLPYFHTDGGWEGTKLMIAVDLVLGPLLTFIVFHPSKKVRALLFDVSFIATIQIIALIWGGHTVYSKRTMAIVYSEEIFNPVTYDKLSRHGISDQQLSKLSDNILPIVYLKQPKKREEHLAQLENLKKGIGVFEQIELYRPIKPFVNEILKNPINVDKGLKEKPEFRKQVEAILSERNVELKDVGFKIYNGTHRQGFIMINRKSGEVLGMVPLEG